MARYWLRLAADMVGMVGAAVLLFAAVLALLEWVIL